jgi:hypothetical protein
MYNLVLQIQASISPVDTRWTFFQAPVILEDALGRNMLIPSEYSVDYLEVLIQHRFREGPGSQEVKFGQYEVNLANRRAIAIATDGNVPTSLVPGQKLVMSIYLVGGSSKTCPIVSCGSVNTSSCEQGGRRW